jgi:selenocysteine-specific elongation factor
MASTTTHAIIGTAGHIDHGKTALIKALTGQDTDRLKEEKERGISIVNRAQF